MKQSGTIPFNALRVVEAVVRHENYSHAAKELDITHSAVSQAVKRLEHEFATKLFERKGGAMRASPTAIRLASAYAYATQELQASIEELTRRADLPNGAE